MKHILIVDAPPTFREFLKEKLHAEKIAVDSVSGILNAFTRLIKILPDLVILDITSLTSDVLEFLKMKRQDINAGRTPIVITGPKIGRDQVATLIPFGVVKYFKKPLKFDAFFDSIGKILQTSFSIDTTPSVLDVHLNDKILFIELAQGLNTEKIMLLKYKIAEIIDEHELRDPKVIVMMTDLDLNYTDGANLELLLDNIISHTKISRRNVKILSFSDFTKELVAGHPRYTGIQVVENLKDVLPSVVKNYAYHSPHDVISDKILTSFADAGNGIVETKFYADTDQSDTESTGSVIRTAVVDDQAIFRNVLKTYLGRIGADVELFENGQDFLRSIETYTYDLIILDLFMPGFSGLEVLVKLRERQENTPVIIYSQAMQKEVVTRALELGAKSYLVKPQKPEAILAKCVEVLKAKKS